MVGKLLATGIVGFWLVMTTALIRLEFFPQPRGAIQVPAELVLRKIFHCDEPTARLNVYYQGQTVGFCKIEFSHSAMMNFGNEPFAVFSADHPAAYRMQSELTLMMTGPGASSRLRLVGDSFFNSQYEMDSFALKTTFGEGRLDARGDAASNRVQLDYAFGNLRDQRQFDFKQMQGAGLAGAMGLPGLAGFGGLGGAAAGSGTAKTQIYLTDLREGDLKLRSYLIDSRLDEAVWAKLWVSERGEILKVETSVGVMLLSDVLSQSSATKQSDTSHDSH